MSYASIDSHSQRAKAHEKAAGKALETSVFRLKLHPDYFIAATELGEAAQQYQLAQKSDDAKRCLLRSAQYRLSDGDHLSAARSFEQAGEYDKAADCYMLNGGIEQAVRVLMKKANSTSFSNNISVQVDCFERAIGLYSHDESKAVLANDVFKHYILKLLANSKWTDYLRVSRLYMKNLILLEQYPFAHKEILSHVVVNIAGLNDLVGAEKALSSSESISVPHFMSSAEFAAAEDLIAAVRDNNEDLLKKTVSKPAVTYLNVEIAKLAKSIKTVKIDQTTALSGGSQAVEALLM